MTDKDPAPLDPPPEEAAAWAFEPVAEVRLALEAAEELLDDEDDEDDVVDMADEEEEEAPDEVLLAAEVEVERACVVVTPSCLPIAMAAA